MNRRRRAVWVPSRSVAAPVRSCLAAGLLAVLAACSTGDGRDLADPDPDLTRVTTTAPTAADDQARGAGASDLAIPVSSQGDTGLAVASADLAPGGPLPTTVTCDGPGTAPTVSWTGNEDRRSLALVVRDVDAGGSVHWLVTDLSGPSGKVEPSAAGTRPNGFGETAWTAPCPGDGLEHRYVFALYALDEPLDLEDDAPAQAVVDRLEATHVDAATLLGTYARP